MVLATEVEQMEEIESRYTLGIKLAVLAIALDIQDEGKWI